MGVVIDLVGRRFGRLTVVRRGPILKRGVATWLCKCDCGKRVTVRGCNLKGKTKGCGCGRVLPEPWMASRNAVLSRYKVSARSRGLDFLLSNEKCFELFAGKCHYCGVPPCNAVSAYRRKDGTLHRSHVKRITEDRAAQSTFTFNGIDRIDNKSGYTEGNCVSCCTTCNFAKKGRTYDEFVAWLDRVAKFRSPGREQPRGRAPRGGARR